MPITYKGPPPAEDRPSAPVRIEFAGNVVRTTERRRLSPFGLLVAFVCAAGIAMAITLLYNGMAVVMETEGGFVAVGGPYEIAHPAPDWIAVIPLSIMGLFLFGGINAATAGRGWGVNLIIFGWIGLFMSLGWNFLRFGFNPPEGTLGAWGWILCGVVFWVMGLAPALPLLGIARVGFQALIDRQANADTRAVWQLPSRRNTTRTYIITQILGAAGGIWGGIALFSVVAR